MSKEIVDPLVQEYHRLPRGVMYRVTYLGPTATKGARIKITDFGGRSKIYPYSYRYDAAQEAFMILRGLGAEVVMSSFMEKKNVSQGDYFLTNRWVELK